MIIKTKDFKEVTNTILIATDLDKNNVRLELVAKKGKLYLNTTNKEFYVAVTFPLDEETVFRAVVDASTFLSLVNGITAPEFELLVDDQKVTIKVGRSNYKIPMIYENDKLLTLAPIRVLNRTVEMSISADILSSILNINSKELAKVKNTTIVNEIQKLYYLDETGCYTFTTGACKNGFTLEKPIKLLLNDRLVKLFKLFTKGNVFFSFGTDATTSGLKQQKVSFETENIYVAAIVTCDDVLLNRFYPACNSLKNILEQSYDNRIVISGNELGAALSRLIQFNKNSIDSIDANNLFGTITFTESEMLITDSVGNTEAIEIENDNSFVNPEYSMLLNLAHLKLITDSCKNEHITINFGDHKAVILTHGLITNFLPEAHI